MIPTVLSRPRQKNRRTILKFVRVTSAAFWISWIPASGAAPEFMKPLSDEEIENARTHWKAAEVLADFASGTKEFPASGGLVFGITPGSFAEEKGIIPGTMLVKRGPFEYGGSASAFVLANQEKLSHTTGELVWITPDHVRHSAPIGDELIGVMFRQDRNLAAWYLHHGQRNPKWDACVLTALLSQDEDTRVSESCWAAACVKGYKPDRLLHWCGVFLSIARADEAAAETHAAAYGEVKKPAKEGDFPVSAADWIALAFQTGNMNHLVQAAKSFPPESSPESYGPPLAEATYLARLAAQGTPRPTESPSKIADSMKRESFLKTGTTAGPKWTNAGPEFGDQYKFPKLLSKAAAALDASAPEFKPELLVRGNDQYGSTWLIPAAPAGEVDVEIVFKIKPKKLVNGQSSTYPRTLTFGLANNSPSDDDSKSMPPPAKILAAIVDYDTVGEGNDPAWTVVNPSPFEGFGYNRVWTSFHPVQRGMATNNLPPFKPGEAWHQLRVVRVGSWAEALVDGKRIALTPVPKEADKPGLFLRVVGCEVTVKSLRADILK